ncbi:MAG: TIGR03936 family radical SAM-associated protein [Peptococcia bacterium]
MKVRLKYSKTEEGRFLSHLDLLRTMQRVIRRAGLPLAYSEGFNPHPKISYGSALAVGVTSDGEYLDFELREKVALDEIVRKLIQAMPPALAVLEAKEIVGRKSKESLMAIINLARYQVELTLNKELSQQEAQEMVDHFLEKEEILVMREGKKGIRTTDIRPGIYSLSAETRGNVLILSMDLQTGSGGNVRPEEVVGGLKKEIIETSGLEPFGNYKIHRQGLFIKDGNRIRTPMDF